jgi:hypothetical protein
MLVPFFDWSIYRLIRSPNSFNLLKVPPMYDFFITFFFLYKLKFDDKQIFIIKWNHIVNWVSNISITLVSYDVVRQKLWILKTGKDKSFFKIKNLFSYKYYASNPKESLMSTKS